MAASKGEGIGRQGMRRRRRRQRSIATQTHAPRRTLFPDLQPELPADQDSGEHSSHRPYRRPQQTGIHKANKSPIRS